jgi:hypothetical protein
MAAKLLQYPHARIFTPLVKDQTGASGKLGGITSDERSSINNDHKTSITGSSKAIMFAYLPWPELTCNKKSHLLQDGF